jgi:hypothetical protein
MWSAYVKACVERAPPPAAFDFDSHNGHKSQPQEAVLNTRPLVILRPAPFAGRRTYGLVGS